MCDSAAHTAVNFAEKPGKSAACGVRLLCIDVPVECAILLTDELADPPQDLPPPRRAQGGCRGRGCFAVGPYGSGRAHHGGSRGAGSEAADAGQRRRRHLTLVALHGPGNIAWRALGRQLGGRALGRQLGDAKVSEGGRFRAAAVLAKGLRSLFNRPDVTKLVEKLTEPAPYWRRVLQ